MTAANSTPLTDGASAIVLASGERAAELGVEPLARVVSSAVYGIDPLFMGLAPAWAIPLAIQRAGLTPEQIDVWEVHEAFSAQALGVLRELPNQLDGFVDSRRQADPQRGRGRHRAPVRRHRNPLRADAGHRTARAQRPLRRHRGVHRIGPGRRPRPGESRRLTGPDFGGPRWAIRGHERIGRPPRIGGRNVLHGAGGPRLRFARGDPRRGRHLRRPLGLGSGPRRLSGLACAGWHRRCSASK